jgi:transposase
MMKFLGLDLHSNQMTGHLIDEFGQKHRFTSGLDGSSLDAFCAGLDKETYVMVEASTNTFRFVEMIRPLVGDVIVANPYRLRLISMAGKKTDRVDAEKLAIFLKMQITSGEHLIERVFVPDVRIQSLRSMFTTYSLIRREKGAIKNRIHALLKQNLYPFTKQYIFGKKGREKLLELELDAVSRFQVEFLLEELNHKEVRLSSLEDRILVEGRHYRQEIEILTSMKGISVFTAIAIIADVADVTRFSDSKKFTSYLRSAPVVDSSNTSTKIKSTNKSGRKLALTLISQSLNHFRDANPKLGGWYKTKLAHMKRGKIRMALCRKVFVEIYQMLRKKEYHNYREAKNHMEKMKKYERFLEDNFFREVA